LTGRPCPCAACLGSHSTLRSQAWAELLDEARRADIEAFKAVIREYTSRRSLKQRLRDHLPFTITWKKP